MSDGLNRFTTEAFSCLFSEVIKPEDNLDFLWRYLQHCSLDGLIPTIELTFVTPSSVVSDEFNIFKTVILSPERCRKNNT